MSTSNDLLMLFLREYPNECVSGRSGISSIQLKELCRNFGIPFNERDTKKFMCQKIKRYLLDRTLLPNSTPNTPPDTFLNDISPTALTSERELLNPILELAKILLYCTNYIRNNINIDSKLELIPKLEIEIYNKINKLDISEQDNTMLKSTYKNILDDLLNTNIISKVSTNTLIVIHSIILKKDIPYELLSLNLPIFNTDYYKNSNSYVQSIPEEDTSNYVNITSDTDSITQESNLSSCINNDYIMNEPYTKEDNPIQIYTLNSQGKFEKSSCITKDELSMHLSTGKGTKIPEVLQAIYTTPSCGNSMCTAIHESLDGAGTNATGKLIVKIPPNNIWVTLGSIERVMKSGINEWYALPLYGGKRRRIGNLDEMFAASRNHGQVPGFHIYKLFTKQEIKDNVKVKETSTDYPIFLFNNTKKLYDIIGGEVTIPFVDNIIDHLLS